MLLFAALKVAGQTTGYFRYDTVRIMKQNGTCELYIINKTKDSLGLLTNVGGGLTRFIKPKTLNDSTIIIGLDTLHIKGTGIPSRLGLPGEDELGITDRYLNMQGYGIEIDSASSYNFYSNWAGKNGLINNVGYVNLQSQDASTLRLHNEVVLPDRIIFSTESPTIPAKLVIQSSDSLKISSPSSIAAWQNDTLKAISFADLSALVGGGGSVQPDKQIVFGTGSGVTSQSAFTYNSTTHKVTSDSARIQRVKTDSAAYLGSRSVVGQDSPSYPWQRGSQWYSDGAYPGVFTVVNTDSVNCLACVPGQAVSVSDSTKGRGLVIATYSESTGGNFIRTMKARGNWLHPTALLSGDILTGLGAWGYGATGYSGSAAGFHIVATENFTDTHWGTEMQFFTTPTGTTNRTYNLIMKQDGSNVFGGQVYAPDALIEGAGSRFFTVNSTDGGATFARFQRSSNTGAVFGLSSTTDQFFTGTVANDFIVRAGVSGGAAANILWSVDGATTGMKLTTSNNLWVGGTDATAKVGLIGATGALRLIGGASNNNVDVYNSSANANLAIPLLYPSSSGNIGNLFRLMPKGTGFSSTLKAGLDIFNTDLITDGTNFELLRILAGGTSYNINPISAGTGSLRPVKIQMNGTDAFTFNTDLTSTAAGDVSVPDEAYDATAWNGSLEVPTKNAIRDKIESLSSGGITSINSQTGSSQTIAAGPGLSETSSSDVHTISLNTTLDAQVTDANNTGTSATDLYSKTIAANQCTLNGQSIHFEAAGVNNDATATVNLEALFAGNGIAGTGAVTISATGPWTITGTIIRATSTTARVYTTVTIPNATPTVYMSTANLTGIDWTTTNILKIRATAGGAGGGSNDITAQMWKVVFQP